MRAAFATWQQRIAPVFDVARQVHLVDADAGRVVSESDRSLPDDLPLLRARHLVELEIGELVCGAISRPLHAMVASLGIRVVPFITGDLREVIQAWLAGGLASDRYAMPGCWGRGMCLWSQRGPNREGLMMSGRGPGGGGRGAGQGGGQGGGQGCRRGSGQRQGGRGAGRGGGPASRDPGGVCVCAQCGHQEPHRRGEPCAQKPCPKCGSVMTRGKATEPMR